MQTYLLLGNWTEQGAENIKQNTDPLGLIQEIFAGMSLLLKAGYLVCGQYDVVVICEAPDDAALAGALQALEQGASIRTDTLRVCTEEEYKLRLTQAP